MLSSTAGLSGVCVQRVRDQRMRFVVFARAVRERIAERVLDDRVARSLLEQLSKLADGRVDTVGTFQEENARHPEVDRIRVALDSSVEFRERTTLFVALGQQRGALHDHVNSQLRARARELVEMQQTGLRAGLLRLDPRHAHLRGEREVAAGHARVVAQGAVGVLALLGDRAKVKERLVCLRSGRKQGVEALCRGIEVALLQIHEAERAQRAGHHGCPARVRREHGARFLVVPCARQQQRVLEMRRHVRLVVVDDLERQCEALFLLAARDQRARAQHPRRHPVRRELRGAGRGFDRKGEVLRAQRGAGERVVPFGDLRMTRGETPEELGDVGRRSFVGDDRVQRQEPCRRAQVRGLEKHREVRVGDVEPMELQCRDAGVTTRLLARRVELEPAFRRGRRFALLLVVVGDLGGLFGNSLVVGTLGRAAVIVGRERIGLPLERCVAVCLQLRRCCGRIGFSGTLGPDGGAAAERGCEDKASEASHIRHYRGTITDASRCRPGALVLPRFIHQNPRVSASGPLMSLHVVGINHRTAPVDVRERVVFEPLRLADALRALLDLPQVSEALIVSTCNRTELYCVIGGVTGDVDLGGWLERYHGLGEGIQHSLYRLDERTAVAHAFAVAAGLDSMVLGEPQILGQLKEAYRAAQETGSTGPVLNRLFQAAFAVAKRVRTETDIGVNAVSVASAAVSMTRTVFAGVEQRTALLIGAGDTAALAARHLRADGLRRMIIANRSIDAARELAAEFQAFAIGLEDIGAHLPEADIVLASTASPTPIVTRAMVEAALARAAPPPDTDPRHRGAP